MSYTLIFVFLENCPSCRDLKNLKEKNTNGSAFSNIEKLFESEDVIIKEFYIQDASMPRFLKITSFFPTTFIIPTHIYNNVKDLQLEDIYSKMRIMNGTIIKTTNGHYLAQLSKNKKYDFLNSQDYISFYNDYVKEFVNTEEQKEVNAPEDRMIEPNTIVETGIYYSTKCITEPKYCSKIKTRRRNKRK